jgi:DNA-binding response OmpR family regulator
VDDAASIRLLCKVNLELEGYRVLEAETLDEARRAIRRGVDVVLLDVHLGFEDGRELLREVRESRPDLPIALFTGTAEIDPVHRAGADALIPKPFTLEELAGTVSELVRRRAAGG